MKQEQITPEIGYRNQSQIHTESDPHWFSKRSYLGSVKVNSGSNNVNPGQTAFQRSDQDLPFIVTSPHYQQDLVSHINLFADKHICYRFYRHSPSK